MICNIQEDFAYISVPDILLDYNRLSSLAMTTGTEISREENNIKIIFHGNDAPTAIRELMSRYHNININFLDKDYQFQNSSSPLVSCIILLNSNYKFVNDLTIPSIIFNSFNTEIEIIVVHNGNDSSYKFDHDIRYIESEKSHIPKAYNNAAKMAKGRYVAFFHDDCFLSDSNWIKKSINLLDERIIAVGPEFHEFETNDDYRMRKSTDKRFEWSDNPAGGFLKEVPLVMEKEKFYEMKGFPEHEILGQEDIFLHQNILKSGRVNSKVDINSYHFTGISTISLFVKDAKLVQDMCNHFVFSKDMLRGMLKFGLTSILDEKIQLCIKMFTYNKHCEEYIYWCKQVQEIGNADNLDGYMPMLKGRDVSVKKLIDGAFKAFLRADDKQGMDIITGVAEFNEVLIGYINYISKNKMSLNDVVVSK